MTIGKGARSLYLLLVVLATALLLLLISPFVSALLMASVLAGALYPWTDWLSRHLRDHRYAAAGLITAAVLLCLVLPLAIMAAVAVTEIASGVRFIQKTIESGGGVSALIEVLPPALQGPASRIVPHVPIDELGRLSASQSGRAAAAVGGLVAATSSALVQTIFMLIMLFFLLVDGHRLVHWLDEVSPLRDGQLRELLIEFRNVSRSVIVSSVATAAVQTVAALAGYLIVGVPHPFFFSLVTFVFAFVPAIGAGGVALFLALLMFLLGHPLAAGFLVIWGVLVVGLSDNLIKPLLIKGGLPLHGAIVFFSLIGGLAVFGPVGLIVGPLVVAFFLAVIRMAQRELGASTIVTAEG